MFDWRVGLDLGGPEGPVVLVLQAVRHDVDGALPAPSRAAAWSSLWISGWGLCWSVTLVVMEVCCGVGLGCSRGGSGLGPGLVSMVFGPGVTGRG